MSHFLRLAAGTLICATLSGCAKTDRVVFVTVTGVGVGYDAATETGHVGYDRQEFYAGPDYPKLKGLPPVAASLQSSLDWFAPSVSQYYATGDAALIATGRKNLPSLPDPQAHPAPNAGDNAPDLSACALNEGCEWKDDSERRLSIIATNTHVGLVVKGTSAAIASLDFGYGRQEASMLPLRTDKGKDYYPSAFASVTVDTDKKDSAVQGLAITQFFATGGAADALAAKRGVKDSFDIMTRAAAASQANGLRKSLNLTPEQIAGLDKQVTESVAAVQQDSVTVLKNILGKDETAGDLNDADWDKLDAAGQKTDDPVKTNVHNLVAAKAANGSRITTTAQLKTWLDTHKTNRDALLKAASPS